MFTQTDLGVKQHQGVRRLPCLPARLGADYNELTISPPWARPGAMVFELSSRCATLRAFPKRPVSSRLDLSSEFRPSG
jgi:hypothetical protein